MVNTFVLVDVLARRVLDLDHRPLKTPLFASFQKIYAELVKGIKSQAGGCQAVLIDGSGKATFARNTSGWSDSDSKGQHSEETLFLEAGVNTLTVQGILITIEPCHKDAEGQRYPGHECQAFFRTGRPLKGAERKFTPSAAFTPIFFLELQPLRQQTSTTSRGLKALPVSQAMDWVASAAGPQFGTLLKPPKPGSTAQVIGQEYMEAADIYAKLTDRGDPFRIATFALWDSTTCDAAVKAEVQQLFSPGAAPAGGSQASGTAMLANTAVAVVGGVFVKAYSK